MTIFQKSSSSTVKEIRERLIHKNKRFIEKSLRALRKKRVEEIDLAILKTLAGHESPLPDLIASNTAARERIAGLFYAALRERRKLQSSLEIAHLTIFDRRWETSDEKTVIDIFGMQRSTRPTLSAIAPNFVAVSELQAYANVRHPDGGKVLPLHVHAVCWGVGIRNKAEKAVGEHQKRYQPRFHGTPAIRLDWVGNTSLDLARVVTYPWKLSDRCKTYFQNDAANPTKSNLHESEANDRFVRFLRLLEIHSLMDINRGIYAGGEGRTIRLDCLREAKAWLANGQSLRPCPLHPDEILLFWAEFMPRIGEARFQLPLIKYR